MPPSNPSNTYPRLHHQPPPFGLRPVLGALLGFLVMAAISRYLALELNLKLWLAASMGASTVLLFAVPGSPFATARSVLGGHMSSALVGLVCVWAVPDIALAASLAVALAIGVMLLLGCLHPPGGGTAVLAVMAQASDARFVLVPILLNAVVLVVIATAYNASWRVWLARKNAVR